MKKRIITLFMAAVLVLAMALPTFAADVNSEEQQILDSWNAVVGNWKDVQGVLHDDVAAQYIAEAKTAMLAVDLPAGAAQDICNNAIAPADQECYGATSQTELLTHLDAVLAIVNPVLAKYEMSIGVDTKTGYATVYYKGVPVGDNRPAVKQTGAASMAGTYGVLALVLAAFVAGVIVMNKKRLNER